MTNPYQNLPWFMLRNNFTLNPNKWSVSVVEKFNDEYNKAKSQGLSLYDDNQQTKENLLIKDTQKYVDYYKDKAEQYEQYEEKVKENNS